MTLASWSPKRILMLWAGGLVLQVLLMLAPMLLARHIVASNRELLRVGAEQDTRWRDGELADSLSLEQQRAESRAAHTYSVNARGDTLFPLVRVPSGRPDPQVAATLVRQTRRKAQYFSVAIFGLIPTVLVLITLARMVVRRRDTMEVRALDGSP